jgi:hopene-associated glycosyltransferase HpnB
VWWLVLPGLLIWLCILLLPWRPWSAREQLDPEPGGASDLSAVTVLIPARNEAESIVDTLAGLVRQGAGLKMILIDDQSTDATAVIAGKMDLDSLTILAGTDLPPGWSGKLWALQQGLQQTQSEYLLLLDADIELLPGTITALMNKIASGPYQLVSLMARLRMESFWEKLLMPAFIFFFKLLYPFAISNSPSRWAAAAAGGCMLLRREALLEVGGFESLKGALIDDCALARRFKENGFRTWIGLSRSALSRRRYETLETIVEMVSRTAFTQLHYSAALLALCTLLMTAAFLLPLAGFFAAQSVPAALACLALMCASYTPTLRYYELNPAWSMMLPLVGLLYLQMTWNSAYRHWRGAGASWKERTYSRKNH